MVTTTLLSDINQSKYSVSSFIFEILRCFCNNTVFTQYLADYFCRYSLQVSSTMALDMEGNVIFKGLRS